MVREFLHRLQDSICQRLETLDGRSCFHEDAWQRDKGGSGISRVISDGAVFEKGGVNFSHVFGDSLPPSASASRPEMAGRSFQAMGVSLVMPHSPEQMAAAARCYGGRKVEETDGFALVDGIPGLRIKVLSALAKVCELVETGEFEEYEDVEVLIPARTRTVTRTRPKSEWRCPESLLQLDTAEVPG
jgi:hypothetical protein